MTVLSTSQDSSANTEQTVTISLGNKKRIFIRHITVTTKGADIAADVNIVVNDNGTKVWAAALRSGSVHGAVFDLGKGIPIRAGDATVVVDDAGASVVTVCSVIYELV